MFHLEGKPQIPKSDLDLVTIGEVLIDMISDNYDEDFSNSGFHRYFGGAPANIAINLSRLGFKSSIITNVGNDGFGKFLFSILKENGVNTEAVTFDDERNTSMVVVTRSKKSPSFIAYRDADKNIKLTDKTVELIKKSKIVHFTSWPISYEPARTTTLNLIKTARESGKIVCFDPNYRKVLWERGHDGVKFIKELLKNVDIVKPSEDDAKHIFGEANPKEYIDMFLQLGVKLVLLTLGEKGVMASDGKETVHFPTLATEVVDTTGAGDAFWSGFYSGILKGKSFKHSIMVGSAVSAYKLKKVGAIVDLPNINEIEKIYGV